MSEALRFRKLQTISNRYAIQKFLYLAEKSSRLWRQRNKQRRLVLSPHHAIWAL
jgi:hypothetical protein